MPTYEFLCELGHKTERRVGMDWESVPCPQCGRIARRVPVYAEQYIQGTTVARLPKGSRR